MFVNLHERLAFHREVAPAPQLKPSAGVTASTTDTFSTSSTPSTSNVFSSTSASLTTASPVVVSTARLVEEFYIIGEQIGSGMCGQVHLCVQKATGIYYVCTFCKLAHTFTINYLIFLSFFCLCLFVCLIYLFNFVRP